MSAELHPLAPHALPSFIGAADGSDPLFSAITVILVRGRTGHWCRLSVASRDSGAAWPTSTATHNLS